VRLLVYNRSDLKYIFGIGLYIFRTVSLFIISDLALYTQHWVYVIQVLLCFSQCLMFVAGVIVRDMQNWKYNINILPMPMFMEGILVCLMLSQYRLSHVVHR